MVGLFGSLATWLVGSILSVLWQIGRLFRSFGIRTLFVRVASPVVHAASLGGVLPINFYNASPLAQLSSLQDCRFCIRASAAAVHTLHKTPFGLSSY